MKNKKIVVDIDGIICEETRPIKECKPILENIKIINKLSKNNKIILFTSRRNIDRKSTLKWLRDNNVSYYKLIMNKPLGDFYIDDRNKQLSELI